VVNVLQILSWLVFLLYAAGFWAYLAYFRAKSERLSRQTRSLMLTAVGTQTVYLILITLKSGHLPVSDTFTVLASCSWFFVLVYLVLEIRLHEMSMGVFFLPVIVLLQLISNLFISFDKPLASVLSALFFEVHVALMISAYSAFTISFITSLMYILLSREMQTKRLGILFDRLPSLEFFDRLSNQAVDIGFALLTIGIALGVYMGLSVWKHGWVLDPKLLAVVVSWAIYVTHLITRRAIGWQGRRAAIVSIIGFNWLLFSFLIVSTFFPTLHKFQ